MSQNFHRKEVIFLITDSQFRQLLMSIDDVYSLHNSAAYYLHVLARDSVREKKSEKERRTENCDTILSRYPRYTLEVHCRYSLSPIEIEATNIYSRVAQVGTF